MASTVVGKTGRVYVQGEILQQNQDPKFSIFKAKSEDESFVLKRVSKGFYDRSLGLAAEFSGSRRLRMHIDCNQEEGILIYPYFRNTLLAIMQDNPDFPPEGRHVILRNVGEAIQELHGKDWVHIDVKPNNVLVNWTCDNEGKKIVTDAVLGDFDIAFKSEGGKALNAPYAIGNAMWRSPEGQTGRGMTKASDIFSFALVILYSLGAGELLLIDNYSELVKHNILPEQEIVTRHFCYFGLVSEGLLKQVNDEEWSAALKSASATAEKGLNDDPNLRFEVWGEELGRAAVDLISRMTKMDPADRMTIDQVLEHRWWHSED